jgi:hypothetical protein
MQASADIIVQASPLSSKITNFLVLIQLNTCSICPPSEQAMSEAVQNDAV